MKKYFRDIYIAVTSILIGMSVTLRRLLSPSVTVQYPKERLPIPKGSRNLLINIIEDCIGCDQCVRACPVDCIEIETIKVFDGEDLGTTSDGSKKRLHVTKFDIDMAKCCYCGLCVDPCPTESLVMTDKFEYSTQNREELIISFAEYTPGEAARLRQRDEERRKEKERKKLAKKNTAANRARNKTE